MAQGYVAYKKFLSVAENLEKRAESLRKSSVSRSTLKTRKKQWACYEKICKEFGWKYFSCDSSQACKYLAYLSNVMKYSSVINYYQTVNFPKSERLFCGGVVRYVDVPNCKGH